MANQKNPNGLIFSKLTDKDISFIEKTYFDKKKSWKENLTSQKF